MDDRRFDSLTRALGMASTRRAALAGLLAVLAPFTAAGQGKGRRRRDLGAAGPCGDRGPIVNRCEQDRDCCTGVCHRNAGRRHGRCRCRTEGQRCRQTRNCCDGQGQGLVCRGRRCRSESCAPNCMCDPPCDQEDQFCDPATGTCCYGFGGPCEDFTECCLRGEDADTTCENARCSLCDEGGAQCTVGGTCCSGDCCGGECCEFDNGCTPDGQACIV